MTSPINTTEPTETPDSPVDPNADIVARFGWEYRLKRYAIVAMLISMGLWFAYDGYVKWPRENAEARAKNEKEPHPGYDVPSNRILGVTLPPLGLLLAIWIHYNSRGQYRLTGDTLCVPGHPPIPLGSIEPLDEKNQKSWDRKGLAYYQYTPADGSAPRRFRLDDFVYEQKPTDDIHDRLKVATAGVPPEVEGQ